MARHGLGVGALWQSLRLCAHIVTRSHRREVRPAMARLVPARGPANAGGSRWGLGSTTGGGERRAGSASASGVGTHELAGGRSVAAAQPDHRELRQGGPRPPELDEELLEGGGEPSTIERPRMRARLVDQGEPARPPGEGRRHDPTPPPSPGESGTGSPEAESTGSGREDETATGPRPKKHKRGRRAPQPLPDQRKASRGEDREDRSAPEA